jgi:SAM-dependent methyltransferase
VNKKERIEQYYLPRLREYSESFRIHGWESAEAHFARFKAFLDNADPAGKKILDVGCGTGELYAYLRRRKIACGYTGIDILEEMVARARDEHPEAAFLCLDLFKVDHVPACDCDILFCSGLFNINMGNNYRFLGNAFEVFSAYARERIVVTLLSDSSEDKEDTYFYYSRDEVRRVLSRPGRLLHIIDDYLPNDFLVSVSL